MRTVVLTGVSRGLGAALFAALAARGDRLIAIGRHFTDDQRALAGAEPGRITLCRADLAALEIPPLTELAGATEAALIHNAGVVEPIGAVGALPAEAIAAAVAVNLTAPMLLTNAFLAAAPDSTQDIRILFITSTAAHRVIGGWSVYSATKAGGERFIDTLADQFGDDPRYTVVNVSPGVMDTDMQASVRRAATAGGYFPDRERFLGLSERGELPSPADIAEKIISTHLTPK